MVTSGLSTRHFGLAGRNRGGFNCYGTIDGQVSVCKLFWCPPQQQTFSHALLRCALWEGTSEPSCLWTAEGFETLLWMSCTPRILSEIGNVLSIESLSGSTTLSQTTQHAQFGNLQQLVLAASFCTAEEPICFAEERPMAVSVWLEGLVSREGMQGSLPEVQFLRYAFGCILRLDSMPQELGVIKRGMGHGNPRPHWSISGITLGWNLTTSYDWGCRGVQVRSANSRPLESADCIRRVGQRLEAAWNAPPVLRDIPIEGQQGSWKCHGLWTCFPRASGLIASGSEGFDEWVETLDGYLAEITNSLPSGDLGIWGSGRDGISSAHVHTLSLMEGCGGWNARAREE